MSLAPNSSFQFGQARVWPLSSATFKPALGNKICSTFLLSLNQNHTLLHKRIWEPFETTFTKPDGMGSCARMLSRQSGIHSDAVFGLSFWHLIPSAFAWFFSWFALPSFISQCSTIPASVIREQTLPLPSTVSTLNSPYESTK